MTAGVGNQSAVDDRCNTGADDPVVLTGMDAEMNPALAGFDKGIQFKGMQRRSASAGIDLGFDGGEIETGQISPFAPADYCFLHIQVFEGVWLGHDEDRSGLEEGRVMIVYGGPESGKRDVRAIV